MPDSPGAEDAKPDPARPSFTGYWKSSKSQQAAQNLTFVSSKLGQPSERGENDAQTEPLTETKAKARRQQVRNAQRQHRQRKANYTKQLEMDVTKLRDDIARVEQEVESLRSQNGAIRSQLARGDQEPVVAGTVDVSPVNATDMAFSTSLAPNYTVSLDMIENLGTPAFHVSRSSPSLPDVSGSSRTASSYVTEGLSGTTPASTVGTSLDDVAVMEMTLSEEQTDLVINFILALEHCCWDHIDQSCFEHHHHHHHHPSQNQQQMAASCPNQGLNGHALMATTLVLQTAPVDVFARINDLHQQLTASTPPSSSSSHPLTATSTETAMASPSSAPGSQLAWPSRALTLTNLRRLAGTLNASASELAPVQAWFELASLYGAAVASDGAVLEGLKRELAAEVRCVVFGAAVQRDVFEAAAERVLGFLPRSWRSAAAAITEDDGQGLGQGLGLEEGVEGEEEEGGDDGFR